ncbi:MAG: hypothetical protein AAGJ36_06185, partial [Pseudomonadota bacterium]
TFDVLLLGLGVEIENHAMPQHRQRHGPNVAEQQDVERVVGHLLDEVAAPEDPLKAERAATD